LAIAAASASAATLAFPSAFANVALLLPLHPHHLVAVHPLLHPVQLLLHRLLPASAAKLLPPHPAAACLPAANFASSVDWLPP